MTTKYKNFFDIEGLADQISGYLKHFDRNLFLEAFEYAAEAHEGQLRKDDKTPYIAHPVAATAILAELHADQDTLISCLLHDVPEDTDRTIEDVAGRFGSTVGYLVEGITKLSKLQYQHSMQERDVESLKKLLLHSAKDMRVLVIKLADRLHNMQTLDNIDRAEKRLRIATETLEIYVPIANLLGIREIKNQLEDLCFKYTLPTEYRELFEKIRSSESRRDEVYKKMKRELSKAAREEHIKVKVQEKKKNLFSIYKYLVERDKGLDDVDERVGMKLVVNSVSDCYKLLGAIHVKFPPLTTKFTDYIASPKSNGYQSLHTTVFGFNGVLIEIQIKTVAMDRDAEYGILAKLFAMKSKQDEVFSTDPRKSQWLKKIMEVNDESDSNSKFIEQLKFDVLEERITVLTPKGKTIDLPKGATVLDFAYALGAEIGNQADGAKVNAQDRALSQILRTQDVVKIVTRETKMPELSWLSFVKTSSARRKIIDGLKKLPKEQKVANGKRNLQKEFDLFNLGLVRNLSFRNLRKRVKKEFQFEVDSIEQVYEKIGEGELDPRDVAALFLKKSDDLGNEKTRLYVKILATNRYRLTSDIYEVLYKYLENMFYFKGWVSKYQKNVTYITEILVENDKLTKLFDELEKIESVKEVYKSTVKGVVLLSLMVFALGLSWIAHPFVLKIFLNSNFYLEYPATGGLLIYTMLLMLFSAILYIVNIINKFFPLFRKTTRFWLISFAIPAIAISTLLMDVFYFKLNLNWVILFIEALGMYLYLGFIFRLHQSEAKKKT